MPFGPVITFVREAPQACKDAACGFALGLAKACNLGSYFTESEVSEILHMKSLAEAIKRKSIKLSTDKIICDGIDKGSKTALEAFQQNLPSEAVESGIGAAAGLVCSKSFLPRFAKILKEACVTLTQC